MLGAPRVDMCPSASDSGPVNISFQSSDAEVVRFLEGRKPGDPIPDNVITGVNPLSVEPRDSSENFWYLHNSVGPEPGWECQISITKSGYWTATDEVMVFTGTATVGRKRTLAFYEGKAHFGERTRWMMVAYLVELHTSNECNYSKDNSSLCRIFLQTNGMTPQGEPKYFAGLDDSVGDYVNDVLLNLLEHDEENLFPTNSANCSQIVAEKNQGQSAFSSRIADEPVHENSADYMFEVYDISNGEYLELNDLCSPETPASSDISTVMSANSDEFFDPNELLRIIENDRDIAVRQQTNLRFNICAPVRSNQVIIGPPPPGSVNENSDIAIEVNNPASWLVRDEPTSRSGHPSSSDDLGKNDRASTSIKFQGSKANQTSDTLCNQKSPKRTGSTSVWKMAKMGKKYWCFASF